jgi:hypothetical protein
MSKQGQIILDIQITGSPSLSKEEPIFATRQMPLRFVYPELSALVLT